MKKRKDKWFKPLRSSYLPISWQGWSIYFIYATYLVASCLVVEGSSRSSIALTAMQIGAQWVAAVVVVTWIAQHKS